MHPRVFVQFVQSALDQGRMFSSQCPEPHPILLPALISHSVHYFNFLLTSISIPLFVQCRIYGIYLLISYVTVNYTSSWLYSILRTHVHNSIIGIWMSSVSSYQWIVLWSTASYVFWAGMVVLPSDPSTWEVEAGGSGVQGQGWL